MPGDYNLLVEGTEALTPIARRSNNAVAVAAEADPEPLAVEVCRAVMVRGIVVGDDGAPVASAKVRSSSNRNLQTTSNDKGEFELAGIASVGKVTISAQAANEIGAVVLEDCDGRETLKIVLGQRPGGGSPGLQRGRSLPALTVMTLDGAQLDWRPGANGNHLLVFCQLGHAAGRSFLSQARTWAQDHDARLVICSIDWSLEQARREASAQGVKSSVLFAGPGGLNLAKEWSLAEPAQAYLISSAGKVLSDPPAGKLPE